MIGDDDPKRDKMNTGNSIHHIKVSSYAGYLELMSSFQQMINAENRPSGRPLFLYRGTRGSQRLISSIEDFRKPNQSIHLGRDIFLAFKSRDLLPYDSSDWDLLSLGRHFGLPSRYLDWTSNSLVALWFAIHKYEDGETILSDETVKVWVLRTMLSDFADINIDDDPFPIAHGKTCIFKPTEMEHRIKRQNSYMMRQVYEYKNDIGKRTRKPEHMEIKDVAQNPIFKSRIWSISIATECFGDMENKLNELGITEDYLFPQEGVFNFEKLKSIVDEIKKEMSLIR